MAPHVPRPPSALSLPIPAPDADPDDLHPVTGLRPGGWWACMEPERPPKPRLTAFDSRCARCCLAMEAVKRLSGPAADKLVMEHRSRGGVELPHRTLLVDETAAAAARRDQR